MESWKDRNLKALKYLRLNIKNLAEILHPMGIISAEQHYEGGGDSGSYGMVMVITGTADDPDRWRSGANGCSEGEQDTGDEAEEGYAWPAVMISMWVYDYATKDYIDKMMPLEDALEFVLEKSIELGHSGWENNEGGMGHAQFDTKAGVINRHHGDYVSHLEWTDSCIGDPEPEPEEVPAAEPSSDLAGEG
jgi:hypothetical protein